MTREKYKTCRYSTGNIGQLIVDVTIDCPHGTSIKGRRVCSKDRCRSCKQWRRRKPAEVNQEFEQAVKEIERLYDATTSGEGAEYDWSEESKDWKRYTDALPPEAWIQ